ncbi:hypothetical protein OEZ85_002784 [Tetradesmus obliquus]|uniref:Dienelactone hydrolase domain-containing protein n=1 Tax=Tetradesmus obliquus TaxID=3088 RepID=A0ABY8TYL0_TETOB|nr:hypothetical protein OEZ85_002784 [Tetradesmus obliquus]
MDVCCAAGAPVSVDYTPVGSFEEVGGVPAYITGSGSKGIIAVYDIFGFKYPQFQQVCDRLAAAGYVVAAPDIFRGQPWTLDKFPPKPEDNLMGWIQGYGWEAVVKKDVYALVEGLKARGVTRFASLGCCWGASMAIQALHDGETFSAAAMLHPSLFGQDKALCSAAKGPVACISTPGDPYESVQEVFSSTEWGPRCVYRRYDNMIHGFCGARGKFEEPDVVKAVGEVLTLLAEFFKANL